MRYSCFRSRLFCPSLSFSFSQFHLSYMFFFLYAQSIKSLSFYVSVERNLSEIIIICLVHGSSFILESMLCVYQSDRESYVVL